MFDRPEIERAALKEVLRQMPAGVLIAEAPSGKIIFVNSEVQQRLGRSMPTKLEDAASEFEIFHPDGRPYEVEEWPLIRSIRDGEEVREWEGYFSLADGTQRWFRGHSSPVYDEEGRIVAGVMVGRDVTQQKRSEERLSDAERRYRTLVEHIPAITYIQDIRHTSNSIYVSPQMKEILGYEPEECTSDSEHWHRTLHPEDRERVLAEDRRTNETGEHFSMEYRQFAKDGRVVWLRDEAAAVRDEEGRPQYWIGVQIDITRLKRAEEQLRESSRRTESILESITDAFFAVDREWRYTYINERALRRIQQAMGKGLTREDLLGMNVWEMFPEAVGSETYEKYHEAMREQKPIHFDTYSAWSDRWIEHHAFPSEEGLSVYFQDITERKRAEQEIERRTHQQAVVAELGLRALAETNVQTLMDEAVTLIARTLEVEYAKIVELLPGGEELLLRAGVGWREGLVGEATETAGLGSQAGYTLVSNEAVIVEDLREETRFRSPPLLVEHGVVSSMTVVIPTTEGPFGVLCAYTTSHRIFTQDDQNFLQAIANVLAMAIERAAEEERLEKVMEAERSRIARDLHDEALQDLSHAMAEAQLLRASLEGPRSADRLGRLSSALKRVERQVRAAIYDLGLEGEQDRPFSELLEVLLDLHCSMAPDLDISLDLSDGVLDSTLGKVGRELLRIIGEALTNVRRHSGARSVLVSVATQEGKLYAEVKDDGMGFDAAQEPPATTTGGMGTRGMRERARALGGDLEIESEPGRGTKVHFELALDNGREEEPEEAVRVLLVDDHAAVREALASAFEQEGGFEVVAQAGSLEEARAVLDEIDVAVVDLGLPDGYGGDLIKELREANPQAQALVLSATLDRGEIARAVEAGAAGVLNKTAHLEEVVDAVRRLRAGETLMPLEEVVKLLRFASSRREVEHEARRAVESLTPREREVLQALAEGLGSEQIAQRLHISLRTQRNHMANILSKLGVHSQLQALVFALRYGVVEIRYEQP